MKVDVSDIDKELVECQKRLRQLNGNKTTLANQIDELDFNDRHYETKLSGKQDCHHM